MRFFKGILGLLLAVGFSSTQGIAVPLQDLVDIAEKGEVEELIEPLKDILAYSSEVKNPAYQPSPAVSEILRVLNQRLKNESDESRRKIAIVLFKCMETQRLSPKEDTPVKHARPFFKPSDFFEWNLKSMANVAVFAAKGDFRYLADILPQQTMDQARKKSPSAT